MGSKDRFYSFWNEVIVSDFPDAKIKYKEDSTLMKFLYYSILWIFNRKFMTHYVTVLGTTVYFPGKTSNEANYFNLVGTLAHEYIHMCDFRDGKSSMLYAAPQWFAIFSLGAFFAFFSLWFLFFLVFLVLLIPGIPSPWRTDIEGNGYAMTMHYKYVYFSFHDVIYDPVRHATALAKQFTGSAYYYMCSDTEKIKKMLLERYETLPKTHKGFKKVEAWLRTQQS